MLSKAERKFSEVGPPNNLEQAIFRTIAYFHFTGYPLTMFEVWKWLLEGDKPYTLFDVTKALEESVWLRERVVTKDGFVALEAIDQSVKERQVRFSDAFHKYEKLVRRMWAFERVPGVLGVAVCNSLAFNFTTKESDIDLFLVTKPGTIWRSRFFTTLPLMLLKERPGEAKENPLCLSFFASSRALKFEHIKIGPYDPYLAFWITTLVPLFERKPVARRMFAENPWVKNMLKNAYPVKRAPFLRKRPRGVYAFLWLPEWIAKTLQVHRFPKRIEELMNKDTRVVVTDAMLKFHDDDRREDFCDALMKLMHEYGAIL